MSKELQAALTELLQKTLTGVEKAGDFAVEQAPLVVQEYLAWGFWSSAFWATALLIPVVIYAFQLRRFCRWAWDNSDSDAEVLPVICTIAAVVVAGIGLSFVSDMIQIAVAPRVYIIEQLKALL